jgi:hypothetical protein
MNSRTRFFKTVQITAFWFCNILYQMSTSNSNYESILFGPAFFLYTIVDRTQYKILSLSPESLGFSATISGIENMGAARSI